MAHDVFISYSHHDKTIADAACAKLEAAGIRCWIAPRDIAPSAAWAGAIIDAIDQCQVVVLVFSGHANHSRQVHREVQQAFDGEKAVVPLRVEDVNPEKTLRYYMGSVHWLDAITPPLEGHLEKLANALKALLGSSGGTPPQELAEAQAPNSEPRTVIAAAPTVQLPSEAATDVLAGIRSGEQIIELLGQSTDAVIARLPRPNHKDVLEPVADGDKVRQTTFLYYSDHGLRLECHDGTLVNIRFAAMGGTFRLPVIGELYLGMKRRDVEAKIGPPDQVSGYEFRYLRLIPGKVARLQYGGNSEMYQGVASFDISLPDIADVEAPYWESNVLAGIQSGEQIIELLGKSSDAVIARLGRPEKTQIMKPVADGDMVRQTTFLIYSHHGLQLECHNGTLAQICFTSYADTFSLPVIGEVHVRMKRRDVEAKIGPPDVVHKSMITGLEHRYLRLVPDNIVAINYGENPVMDQAALSFNIGAPNTFYRY